MTEQLQNLSLSLRISEALRKRLEDIRTLTALRRGESVSTSEIAKHLLESAREDRFEVADLLAEPTESLLEIRRKGEAGQALTRAQWTVVAYFAQQGAEAFSKNPLSRESYIGILEAFAAAHALRANRSGAAQLNISQLNIAQLNNDEYYLGNLPSECRPECAKTSDAVTPELVQKTIAETVRRLGNPATKWTPQLASRNLYVLLDDEKLSGGVALNEALAPYWPVLWRVAARGHYFANHKPVRDIQRRQEAYQRPIPSLTEGGYTLSFARGEANEFSILMSFPGERGPMYPLVSYPMIAEFRAVLNAFPPNAPASQRWNGEQFFGYFAERDKEPEFWFRAHANGITFSFSVQEWQAVRELFRRAWELPEVCASWDLLSLDYGEL